MQIVDKRIEEIFFLDGPGEIGKTFLIRLILAAIRPQNDTVLALASSGIERINIARGRFQANITCNSSIDIGGRNACMKYLTLWQYGRETCLPPKRPNSQINDKDRRSNSNSSEFQEFQFEVQSGTTLAIIG
ncbi:unnamed protein product [Onchocerca flexuosa]|uniref:ATP-dependent DNA helicase n=1 Tax=Onchocerca flexuosa TaxID=387005 RepID=A0A183I1W3_9BILA|nr:unnamed protein product [Onchocerca flexuosa]